MSGFVCTTFDELAVEFSKQSDGNSVTPIVEEKRLWTETTDSVISNIMPCGFPNPEQLLMGMEEKYGRQWDEDLNIQGSRDEYILRMVNKAY